MFKFLSSFFGLFFFLMLSSCLFLIAMNKQARNILLFSVFQADAFSSLNLFFVCAGVLHRTTTTTAARTLTRIHSFVALCLSLLTQDLKHLHQQGPPFFWTFLQALHSPLHTLTSRS